MERDGGWEGVRERKGGEREEGRGERGKEEVFITIVGETMIVGIVSICHYLFRSGYCPHCWLVRCCLVELGYVAAE